jgi:ribosome-associated protein
MHIVIGKDSRREVQYGTITRNPSMDLSLSDDPIRSDTGDDERPSRSRQRRDALAVLDLAGQLVELTPSRLAKLALPDDVRDEIANVQRTASHIARKRQLAFLAKIMRRHDDGDFAAARAGLGENRERQRQETAAMHRLEALRERLLGDDETALSGLIAEYPHVDRQRLRSLIRQARVEKDTPNKPPRAYREIFRLLKELQAGNSAGD